MKKGKEGGMVEGSAGGMVNGVRLVGTDEVKNIAM